MKKYLDKKLPLQKRKEIYQKEVIDKMMNPFKEYIMGNQDFDPMADDTEEYKLAKRKRIKPPKKLETFGLFPKEIRTGQMIGMYESKQDLYLLFAHRCNELQEEIDNLKKIINNLKNE